MILNKRVALSLAAACAVGGIVISGSAKAATLAEDQAYLASYSCSDSVYGTSGTYWDSTGAGYSRSTYDSSCVTGHTSNTPGSVVTAVSTLRAATTQTVGLITDRLGALRSSNGKGAPVHASISEDKSSGEFGLSGGDMKRGIGIWVQGTFSGVDNDAVATKFDGNVYTIMAGVDKKIGSKAVIGLAAGYENSDLDTDYNLGDIEGDGYLVAPYLSVSLNDTFSIDVNAGYAWLDYDMKRTDATNSELFTGTTDATRYWGAISANGDWQRNKLGYGASLGVIYSKENRDAFNETGATTGSVSQASVSSKLGQARLGGEVSYDLGKVEPYASARLEYDFTKTKTTVASTQTAPADDDLGATLGAGLNLKLSPSITGHIGGEYGGFFREDYKDYSATARLRVEF